MEKKVFWAGIVLTLFGGAWWYSQTAYFLNKRYVVGDQIYFSYRRCFDTIACGFGNGLYYEAAPFILGLFLVVGSLIFILSPQK